MQRHIIDILPIILLKGGRDMDEETLKMFSELLDSKLGALENRLDVKLDKNTMLLENLTSKVETIAKLQKLHMEQNEKALNEISKNLNKRIDAMEVAIKYTSEGVEEIQENLEPLCEDMIVVKSVVKIISGDIVDLNDKIESMDMKEFNNEGDLFMVKKRFSQ